MRKIKILHIHNDVKFINGSKRFLNENFDNTIVFFSDERDIKLPSNVIALRTREKEILLNLVNAQDAIVIYGFHFDFIFNYLNKIKNDIIVFWRFFGYEFYGLKKQKFLSKKSFDLTKPSGINSLKIKLYNLLHFKEYKIKRSLNRINYFLGLYEEEYELLKKEFKLNIPFIRLSINHENFIDFDKALHIKKTNKIIIGNSANAWNNHLDIIELICEIKNYKFSFLLSYGGGKQYKNAIINKLSQCENSEIIDNFMDFDKFKQFYSKHDALVINSYRQLAVGNIYLAISLGLKVYLNKKNTFYHYLLKKNIKVYTIEDLKKDLLLGQCFLAKEIQSNNRKNLLKLFDSYTSRDFSNKILNLFKNKK